MTGLEILGLICFIIIGFFLPRTLASILAVFLLGGGAWWGLFIPLLVIGIVVDIATDVKAFS